ncbi:MAG: hypothetical protein DRI84_04910 [Bacteroidetes bacterium]|nr:MAG: hypothetical protein DRI84_04910 [Bacteroidota bacterium]
MRRQFILPEEDIDYLESTEYEWETIINGRLNWVIIYNYPVPEGYNHDKVNVALRINSGYPVSQIDMVYFNPSLQLTNGKVIGASTVTQIIENKNWQRWSRHRTGHNPWRSGVDDISTHLQLVAYWIERELKK